MREKFIFVFDFSLVMKINLKYFPQHKDYSCGPVCLRMIFTHLGRVYTEDKLVYLCHTSKKSGTSHQHLIDEIKKEGFVYLIRTKGAISDIVEFIEAGYPVVVNYLEPFSEEGHYAVVSGYDLKEKIVILADPCNGNDYSLKWDDFEKHWHNGNNSSQGWMLIVGRESINL